MRTEARNGFKYLAHFRKIHHHPANPFRSVRKMLQAQTIRTRHLPTRRENYSSQPRPAIQCRHDRFAGLQIILCSSIKSKKAYGAEGVPRRHARLAPKKWPNFGPFREAGSPIEE